MTRVSPALLRAAVAANAARSPIAPHHRIAREIMAWGAKVLTEQERWFLDAVLRLPKLSDRQQLRLNDIASRVERNR